MLMMPSSRPARNGPVVSSGTLSSVSGAPTGIAPPVTMRSMWLNVSVMSPGTKTSGTR